MRTIKDITHNKFLNIKEIHDASKHVNGYQYAERLGVNSIAFICVDRDKNYILLNNEYKPPIDDFILGAFGGSIDKDKSQLQIVIDEAREEAGFDVKEEDVRFVGYVLVSTQMNQYCFLYIVDVEMDKQQQRQPENAVEAMATTEWMSVSSDRLSALKDWKPITIFMKAKETGIL